MKDLYFEPVENYRKKKQNISIILDFSIVLYFFVNQVFFFITDFSHLFNIIFIFLTLPS